GLFLKQAIPNNKNDVPERSLWFQGIWASLLCLSGQYGNLLDMVSFVIVIFYMITVLAMMYQRWKRPDLERPYKTFLYPIPPLVYLLIRTALCVLLLLYKSLCTWSDIILILMRVPIYYFANRQKPILR